MNRLKQYTEGFDAWLDADRNAIHAVLRSLPDSVTAEERSELYELMEQVSEKLHVLDNLTDKLMERAQADANQRTEKARKV